MSLSVGAVATGTGTQIVNGFVLQAFFHVTIMGHRGREKPWALRVLVLDTHFRRVGVTKDDCHSRTLLSRVQPKNRECPGLGKFLFWTPTLDVWGGQGTIVTPERFYRECN